MHHIICDGWSVAVLLRDMARCYVAHRTGERAAQSPGAQLIDLATAERAHLAGDRTARLLTYWRGRLQGAPDIIDLPTDLARPDSADRRAAQCVTTLSGTLTAHLEQLAQDHGATLFMVLLTAFNILLTRWCRTTAITVGTQIANRTLPHAEDVVGHITNTLVLNTSLTMRHTFLQALDQVAKTTIEDFAHQDLPYEKLVEALQPTRTRNVNPLFQVMFVLQTATPTKARFHDIDVSLLPLAAGTAKFPLTLNLTRKATGIEAVFEYMAASFSAPMMLRMAGHFENLLWSIARDPFGPIGELAMLSEREHAQLTHNPAVPPLPVTQCLHEIFEQQAARLPDAIAITDGEQSVTYAQLEARANSVAHLLAARGVGPDCLVALCVPRGCDMIVGLLGILKAGGAYLPVDPNYPAERIDFMLEDAAVTCVLAVPGTVHLAGGRAAIDLTTDVPVVNGEDPGPVCNTGVTPKNLAYVIYTSGSTGKPKGVMVEHAQVVRLFRASAVHFDFTRNDVWSLFHAISFDFSVWEIWGALLHGGRLVIVPYWTTRTPELFHRLLVEQGVTIVNQTPSAFRELASVDAQLRGCKLAGLRAIIFGGERLEMHDVLPWLKRYGERGPELVNMYGITETTVHVTFRRIGLQDTGARSPIGQPLQDLTVYLLDENLQPVPIGVAGEIFVGGCGLARGYLGRPELTAERFIQSPFHDGQRLYRSGDLALRDDSGELYHLGRIDHQVKIRGFRIELGELNAALVKHLALCEAAVLVEDDADRGKNLVAYCVARDVPPHVNDLRAYLGVSLPDFMIPSVFAFVPALPLTLNGKLDRAALSASRSALPQSSAHMPPRGPIEEAIACVFAKVLGVNKVSRTDNFFSLGGDSIRALRVCAEAQSLNIDISLPDLFQAADIAELGVRVSRRQKTVAPAAIRPFALLPDSLRAHLEADHSIADAYPLSRLQEGMLFHSLWAKGTSTYHDVFWTTLSLSYDHTSLAAALQTLILRHEVLRTSFHLGLDEAAIQIVHRFVAAVVIEEDWTNERDPAVFDDWARNETKVGFEISAAPLFRLYVHKLADTAFRMVLSFHHAILDGWSLASLIAELEEDYAARLAQIPPSRHPQPATRFVDFIAEEQRTTADPAAIAFWRSAIQSLARYDEPNRRLRKPQGEDSGTQIHKEELTPSDVSALQCLARDAGVGLKSVLLGAHCRMLSILRCIDRVTTGLVVNGRFAHGAGDEVLGLFLNTIPVCVDAGNDEWPALIRRCAQLEGSAFPHRIFPMAEMQRLNSGASLFDVLFNYTHFHIVGRVSANIRQTDTGGLERTNFPLVLTVNLDPMTEKLSISLQCWRGALSDEAARLAVALYVQILRVMSADEAQLDIISQNLVLVKKRLQGIVGTYPDQRLDVVPTIHVTEPPAVHAEAGSERTTVLVALFKAVLKRDDLGAHDDFFALGGDSLLALRLCQRFLAKTGLDLPPSVLFEHRTPAALDLWLGHEVSTPLGIGHTDTIERSQINHTICFMPTLLGSSVIHDPLARAMASYGHVVLCSLPGRGIDEHPLEDMVQIARHCGAQIAAESPGHEYTLIGWSFGGVLAYETARQMSSLGLPVRAVILIDAYLPVKAQVGEFSTDDIVSGMYAADPSHSHIPLQSSNGPAVAKASLLALQNYLAPPCQLPLAEIRATRSVVELLSTGRCKPLCGHDHPIECNDGDHYSIMSSENHAALLGALSRAITAPLNETITRT